MLRFSHAVNPDTAAPECIVLLLFQLMVVMSLPGSLCFLLKGTWSAVSPRASCHSSEHQAEIWSRSDWRPMSVYALIATGVNTISLLRGS